MILTGVNNKCVKCQKGCKQGRLAKVIICPDYEYNGSLRKEGVVKHSKSQIRPSTALNSKDSAWIRAGVQKAL